jgi:hypothetical protein
VERGRFRASLLIASAPLYLSQKKAVWNRIDPGDGVDRQRTLANDKDSQHRYLPSTSLSSQALPAHNSVDYTHEASRVRLHFHRDNDHSPYLRAGLKLEQRQDILCTLTMDNTAGHLQSIHMLFLIADPGRSNLSPRQEIRLSRSAERVSRDSP